MLAVIGGTGFYEMDGIQDVVPKKVETPFGPPSAELTFAKLGQTDIVFLPRHGPAHGLLPHEINYRANIYALKQAGARQVIAVSACGSLRETIEMGHFIVPHQYFDHTRGRRENTFFGAGLAGHVSTAEASCRPLADAIAAAVRTAGATVHEGKTFACVEGPRLGTRAESFFLRESVKADIVGMTCVPEAFLAREAQLNYATLAIATDYDCWHSDPSRHVTVAQVIESYGASLSVAKRSIAALAADLPSIDEKHRQCLAASMLTPDDAMSSEQREIMNTLRA